MSEHVPLPPPSAPPPRSTSGVWLAVVGAVGLIVVLLIAAAVLRDDGPSIDDTAAASTISSVTTPGTALVGDSSQPDSTSASPLLSSPIAGTCPETTMPGWPTEPLGWQVSAPSRVIDTRNDVLLAPDSCVSVLLPQADATEPVRGALVGIGVVGAPQDGYVTAYPCGYERPTSSAVSVRAGALGTATAIVPAGVDGTMCFFVSSGGSLIVDLLGVFDAGGDGIQGTAEPLALAATTIDADSEVRFLVPGALQGASGLIVDLEVTSELAGFLTPCDGSGVSLMNFAAGRQVRQLVVPVVDDRICVKPSGNVAIDMVTAIWFRSDAPNRLVPSVPLRYDGRSAEIPGVAWTPNTDNGAVIVGSLAFLNRGAAAADLKLEPDCGGATGRSLMTAGADQPTAALVAIYVPPGGQVCMVPDQAGDSIFDYQADALN